MSTPLHLACEKGHYDAAALLIKEGANDNIRDDVGHKPIHRASVRGHDHIVELLICNGANINTQTVDLDNSDSDGDATSLHIAIYNDHHKVAKVLLKYGASTEIGDAWSASAPLHIAIKRKDKEMVKMLICNKADMHHKNYPREGPCLSPLEYAIKKGYTSMLKALMTNCKNDDIDIALKYARRYKRRKATAYLRSIRS